MTTLAADFFFDLDLILLANMLPRDEMAIFGISARLFVLASFGVGAVYSIIMPDMVAAEADANEAELQKKVGEANLIGAGLAIVFVLGCVALGGVILSLFGEKFVTGQLALIALSASLLVRALFGPSTVILSTRNRPYAALPALFVGIATLIIANLVLIPIWGLNGASVAAFLSMSVGAGLLWYTAKRITGIDVSIWPVLASHWGKRVKSNPL